MNRPVVTAAGADGGAVFLEAVLRRCREGGLRGQAVGRTEDTGAGFGSQNGAEARGEFQVAAGVAAAVEVQDDTLPPLIPGQEPGSLEPIKLVLLDHDLPAPDGAHQLAQLFLALPDALQGKTVNEGLEQLQLSPDGFGGKTHAAASFCCLLLSTTHLEQSKEKPATSF